MEACAGFAQATNSSIIRDCEELKTLREILTSDGHVLGMNPSHRTMHKEYDFHKHNIYNDDICDYVSLSCQIIAYFSVKLPLLF